MAALLSNKIKIKIIFCAVTLLLNCCAYAFESSFDDNFFNSLNKPKKEKTPEMIQAKEELKKRKIAPSVDSFVKHVKKNDVEVLKLFVQAGFNVNSDFYTDYPIYYAAKANSYEAAKFLLENGANPNLGFNPPLITAINNKNSQMAHILMQYGAKVNTTDFMSGNTLLYNALRKNQIEIARDLIQHGARIDAGSKYLIERNKLFSKLGLNEDFENN